MNFEEFEKGLKETTGKGSAKQTPDLMTEISQNTELFLLPYIYLVVQIIRMIFDNRIYSTIAYEYINIYMYASIFISCVLAGLVLGGLVTAVQCFSKKFKWVYIIPYCSIYLYWIITYLNYVDTALVYTFELTEIFVVLGITVAMEKTSLGQEKSEKSITAIAAIATVGATVAYRFMYILLMKVFFDGYAFGVWDCLVGAAFTLGAIIAPSIAGKTIRMNKLKRDRGLL